MRHCEWAACACRHGKGGVFCAHMVADQHVHTPLCGHASGAPEEYVRHARLSNVPAVCFTDHAPAPDGYDASNRMPLERFGEYIESVQALRDSKTIRVGFGIEADYYPGCERFLRGWLSDQPFDLVIGSVHFIDDWGFDHPANLSRWRTSDVQSVWRKYFDLVCRLADTGLYDVLGHFDLPKKFGYRPPRADVEKMAAAALDRLAAANMAIEINTGGLRKPVGEAYPADYLLRLAKDRNIAICFGSDAHAPDETGYAFPAAVAMARAAGYDTALEFHQREGIPVPLPAPRASERGASTPESASAPPA